MATVSFPIVDSVLASTFAISIVTLGVVFYATRHAYPHLSIKQNSWVLSAFTSAVMTLGSLPYLVEWVTTHNLSATYARQADLGCAFFMAYLFTDLSLGSIHYRSEITLLTGWIHHTAYLFLLGLVIIPNGLSPLFCMCCLLEFPTFLLAIGSLDARYRNDYLFATVFFLTRIVFHIYLGVTFAIRALSPEGGSWIPTAALGAALPMHVLWMKDCVAGILRRRARAADMHKAGINLTNMPMTPLSAPLTSALLGPTATVIASVNTTAISSGYEGKLTHSRFLTPRPARAAFDSLRTRLGGVSAQDLYIRLRDPDTRALVADHGVAALRRLRDRLRRSRVRIVL